MACRLTRGLVIAVLMALIVPGAALAQPENDECGPSNPAITVGVVIAGSNVGANISVSLVQNPALPSCNQATFATGSQFDVYYRFTPPATATYEFNCCNSGYDNTISVHTACPATQDNMIACNDDSSSSSGPGVGHPCTCCGPVPAFNALIESVSLSAGVQYTIRVAGYNGASGDFVILVTQVVTGACCTSAGACSLTTSSSCTSPSTFGGANSTCGGANCPTGACCAPAGTCTNTTEAGCASPSVFRSLGSSCEAGDCASLLGACCATNGSCSNTMAAGCNSPSAYQGVGADCHTCEALLGACCASAGTCSSTLAAGCTTAGSVFGGAGSVCGGSACPTGACCAPSGSCTNTLHAGCTDPNIFQEAGTSCAANGCTALIGACCGISGTCTSTLAGGCANPSVFRGTGTSCTSACQAIQGGCCDAFGACTTRLAAGCSGFFEGPGTNCVANPCVVGACCTGSSCNVFAPFACTSPQVFISSSSSCTPNPCGGSCCNGTTCNFTGTSGCAAPQTFTLGMACTPTNICAGACCSAAGACTSTTLSACMFPSMYKGAGTVCNPVPCTVPGAPGNDLCANAVLVNTAGAPPYTINGTVAAALHDGEGCGGTNGVDVYYRFNPPSSGEWVFSLCSSSATWDSVVSVHNLPCNTSSATLLSSGGCASTGSECGLHARCKATLTAGTNYLVRVGTFASTTSNYGPFALTIAQSGACCAFNSSTLAVACSVLPQEQCPGNWLGPASTCGTSNANCPASGSCCNTLGVCYPAFQAQCSASGYTWTSGGACTNVPAPCITPTNDTCASAKVLMLGVPADGSNTRATESGDAPGASPALDSGCSSVAPPMLKGVWFRFTSPFNTSYLVSACGSTFDTVMQVYDNIANCSSPASWGFTPGGCDEDACLGGVAEPAPGHFNPQLNGSTFASKVLTISATVGQSFYIRLSSSGASTTNNGNYRLLITFSSGVANGSCCSGSNCITTPAGQCTGTFTNGQPCTPNPCAGGASGVCCRGATCTTASAFLSTANCVTPGTNSGGRYVSAATVCNAPNNFTTPCCYPDYNKQSGISVQDIFDFLNDWFTGTPYANVGGNGTSGTLSVQNIFDFLNDWFAGGCS